MRLSLNIAGIVLLVESLATSVFPADLAKLDLDRRFEAAVRPFLETHCVGCHGKEKQKGKLDLSLYSNMEAVAQDYRRWGIVLEMLKAEEMPPEEAERQPSAELRQSVIDWIQAVRTHEAERNAGDPGPVLARRLSNAEYDYTIRDLTGVDIRPAREFPVDPANEAGFDNSGESLAMSPALLKKSLEAARRVAEHLVLKPNGFVFAPHPVVTETDRDKYCVKRIVDFYQRQPTNYADYFMTAWRFKNRAALGKPEAGLADFAAEDKISFKYLSNLWSALNETTEEAGPMAVVQAMWRGLPAPDGKSEDAVRRDCEHLRNFVGLVRQKLKPEFKNLTLRGIASGSQPLVLWKDRQYATNRMRHNSGALKPAGESETGSHRREEADRKKLAPELSELASSTMVERVLEVPEEAAARARFEAAIERFCRIFPDAFYVSERGRIFLDKDEGDRGRLLSAGFHLMVGYFRDAAPLCELILDEQGRRAIDALWAELNFITLAPMRQYKDYIFFERAEPPRFAQGAEFDFARSEDKDVTSQAKIDRMAETYLAKARKIGADSRAIDAIQYFFTSISTDIRWVEKARLEAEPSHLEELQHFAARAYRRPLSPAEREDLLKFYRTLRTTDGLDHEEAIRDTVASVLMSPHFSYRVDLPIAAAPFGKSLIRNPQSAIGQEPLSDYALASRLSYFLWSSLPDAELFARAAGGELHRPEILIAQARRMARDERVRGFVTEFGGHWLDFRRFEEHNAVDRERFRSFDNALRQAMFDEPIHFFVHLVREDRSVLDFLFADYTFVNPALAEHYGLIGLGSVTNEWKRVDGVRNHERGGLLPMAVFLTRNSPGLRTSPVKRGYWVVRRLLGQYIPPPPDVVPELPGDEAKLGNLTLRDMLAKHREDKSCAGCHQHFDSIGLAFEGYGPIGERRSKDLGGRTVDNHAAFPGGGEGTGLDGLRTYLRERRQEEFLDNLCRKLLAYALGRSLLLSDDRLIRDMRAKLAANGHRFGALIDTIVTSPQFLNKRVGDDLTRR